MTLRSADLHAFASLTDGVGRSELPTPAELTALLSFSDDKRTDAKVSTRFGLFYDGEHFYAANRHTSARIACRASQIVRERISRGRAVDPGYRSHDGGNWWAFVDHSASGAFLDGTGFVSAFAPIRRVYAQAEKDLARRAARAPVSVGGPKLGEVNVVVRAVIARAKDEQRALRLRHTSELEKRARIERRGVVTIESCAEVVRLSVDSGRWQILICPYRLP